MSSPVVTGARRVDLDSQAQYRRSAPDFSDFDYPQDTGSKRNSNIATPAQGENVQATNTGLEDFETRHKPTFYLDNDPPIPKKAGVGITTWVPLVKKSRERIRPNVTFDEETSKLIPEQVSPVSSSPSTTITEIPSTPVREFVMTVVPRPSNNDPDIIKHDYSPKVQPHHAPEDIKVVQPADPPKSFRASQKGGRSATDDTSSSQWSRGQKSPKSLYNDFPKDGCLVLGREDPEGMTYNTRYRIYRKAARKGMTLNIIDKTCLPCRMTTNRTTVEKAFWAILRSEVFLLGAHLIMLILGVSKQCTDMRNTDPERYFYQSLAEVILATVIIGIRTGSVWTAFHVLKKPIVLIEHVERHASVRGKSLRKHVVFYVVFGAAAGILNLLIFILLHTQQHLGWTILTNNAFVVSSFVISRLVKERLEAIAWRAQIDEHVVALYESVLLLKEAFVHRTVEHKKDYYDRLDRFLNAFSNTSLFCMPPHVLLLKEFVPDWEYCTSGQVVTTV